jgi:iron complex transport system substrate-binding protein
VVCPRRRQDKILKLAPCIGINTAHLALPEPPHRYVQLAQALGADLAAGPVTNAKSRYDKAVTALRTTATGNSKIKVLAGSASTDLFYVSDARVYDDLSYFRQLGVDFVVPDKVTGGFFENLSWEQANKYPADLIMLDDGTAGLQPKDLKSNPTWSPLPAVRAGQITPWLSEPRFSCAGCAPRIELLARAL